MLKDRIQALMQAQTLTASKFAEAIGVQPSSISHILSGRNKPGYDFLLSILNRFPEIDPDWLLTGRGNMYRNLTDESIKTAGRETTIAQATTRHSAGSVAAEPDQIVQPQLFPFTTATEPTGHLTGMDTLDAVEPATVKTTGVRSTSAESRVIEKIIILYTDGTFGIYSNR